MWIHLFVCMHKHTCLCGKNGCMYVYKGICTGVNGCIHMFVCMVMNMYVHVCVIFYGCICMNNCSSM